MWRIHRVYNIPDEHQTREIIQALQETPAGKQEMDAGGSKPQALPDRYRRLAIQTLHRGEYHSANSRSLWS